MFATETQTLYINRPENILSTRKDKWLYCTNNFEAPFIFQVVWERNIQAHHPCKFDIFVVFACMLEL